ncbi:hypothetical protein [Shewanella waksmanii]|uniref:hypothetical protein n=1 Tax=Shewanella waksmanii TaxID=213783 RepID=UPI003735A0BC
MFCKPMVQISCALMLLSASSHTYSAPQVGVMVGSDSGINIKFNDIKLGVGLNDLSLSADKLFNFTNSGHFYYGFGGKLAHLDGDKDTQLAARAVFGAHAAVEQFRFFIEAQPSLYLIDNVSVELEAIAGVRYQF